MARAKYDGQLKIVDDVEPLSLHYALDVSNASNIRMRQFMANIADKTSYEVGATGGVFATINIPASGFVNGRESYLRFQLMTQKTSGVAPTTATNSALCGPASNIIYQVRLRSPSSPDIENYTLVNHVVQTVEANTMSKDFIDTRGQEMGYYRGYDAPTCETNPCFTGNIYGASGYDTGVARVTTATPRAGISASVDIGALNIGAADGTALYIPAGGAFSGSSAKGVIGNIFPLPLKLVDQDSTEVRSWVTGSIYAADTSAARYYTIPVRKLLGFFDQNRYLPMKELGGLILEVQFAPFYQAFVTPTGGVIGTGDATSYLVNNLQLMTDVVQLSDAAALRVEAATKVSGASLDIAYQTWEVAVRPITAASSNIDLEIQKSLSDVVAVYTTFREYNVVNGAVSIATAAAAGSVNAMSSSATIRNTGAAAASVKTELDTAYTGQSGLVVSGFQYSLNAEQFPVRKVQTLPEMYAMSLKAWNKYSKTSGGPSMRQFRDFCFTVALDLESDDNSAFVGKTVNSGSVLRLTVDVSDTGIVRDGGASTVSAIGGLMATSLIKYTRVLRISDGRTPVVLS